MLLNILKKKWKKETKLIIYPIIYGCVHSLLELVLSRIESDQNRKSNCIMWFGLASQFAFYQHMFFLYIFFKFLKVIVAMREWEWHGMAVAVRVRDVGVETTRFKRLKVVWPSEVRWGASEGGRWSSKKLDGEKKKT